MKNTESKMGNKDMKILDNETLINLRPVCVPVCRPNGTGRQRTGRLTKKGENYPSPSSSPLMGEEIMKNPSPLWGEGKGEGGFEVFLNEKGTILVTMLLLMIIVTLIGVIAINTATVDIQITGNTKRESIAMGAAEAGIDLSIPIIELTLAAGQLTTSSSDVVYTIGSLADLDDGGTYDKDTTFIETEIFDDQDASVLVGFDTDVSISSFGSDAAGINLDIDRMYSYAIEGSSIEFAAGYEGIGAGAGGGGIGILYKINSQGTK